MSGKVRNSLSFIAILICCFIVLPQMGLGDPATDCNVSGSLQVNGQDAPVGSLVEAYIDGNQIVSLRTTKSGEYSMTIPQYDPAHPDEQGYQSTSDVVVIKVDKREAQPTFNPEPGTKKINLEVKTSLNVKLTTWGKIKALFK
jgi:hypothetical protein